MSLLLDRPTYVQQSVSLPRTQATALRRIAREDGHGNLSRVVQDLIEAELRRRYGRNWATEIADAREDNAA